MKGETRKTNNINYPETLKDMRTMEGEQLGARTTVIFSMPNFLAPRLTESNTLLSCRKKRNKNDLFPPDGLTGAGGEARRLPSLKFV